MYNRFYLTFIYEDRYLFFLDGLKTTLILTLSSFIFGTLLGALFCFLIKSKNMIVSKATRLIVNLFVQLPTMVMMMLFVYVIFGDFGLSILLLCIFALTIKSGSYMCNMFITAVNSVSSGEIEAARTLGMSSFEAFVNVVFPQVVKNVLPLYKNQFITSLQETSVVGYLAVMDLTKASSVVTSRTMDAMFGLICISFFYLVLGYMGTAVISLLDIEKHLKEADIND